MATQYYLSLYLINNPYLTTNSRKSFKENYLYISTKCYYSCSKAII